MDLFTSSKILTPIPVPDGELSFLAQLDLSVPNDEVLARLLAETAWRSESITLWGKQFLQPRLTAWHGEAAYTYSGLRLEPLAVHAPAAGNPPGGGSCQRAPLQQRPAELLPRWARQHGHAQR